MGGSAASIEQRSEEHIADSLRWAEAQFGVDLPWAFVPILSVSIAVAGIVATWEICRLRRHQRSL